MNSNEESICKKCNGIMIKSKALEMEFGGYPDFPNDKYPCTISPNGSAHLVDCLKCSSCGWSIYT